MINALERPEAKKTLYIFINLLFVALCLFFFFLLSPRNEFKNKILQRG